MEEMQELISQKNGSYYSELAMQAKYNQEAFSELYDYFFPRVYNFIFARIKNAEQADDIISTTFEKVFLHLEDYDKAKGAFSTWIFRIAINEMENVFRKTKRLNEASWEDFFDPADVRNTPEQDIVSDEGDKMLLKAMDKLNEREKRIVSLKYFTWVSNKEIAEMEGMTASNVGVVLHRSLDKLKKLLEADGYTL